MNRNDQARITTYKVVVNHEEQYSIWPADRENPPDWNDAGERGSSQACLAYIQEVRPDRRPLDLLLDEQASPEQ